MTEIQMLRRRTRISTSLWRAGRDQKLPPKPLPKILTADVGSPGKIFVVLFAIFGLASSLWSLSTPLMAYPDEPSHTVRAAAVVRGQVTVEPGTSFGNGVHVRVPAYIANLEVQKCFAFSQSKTADCAPLVPTDANYTAIGVSSAGLYNPLYYAVVGLPSLILTGAPSIYAMRILSALGCAAFLAAGMTALTQLRRPRWPVTTAAMVLTPMIFFLSSGINPNSIEIAATFAAFGSLLAVLDGMSRKSPVAPAVATVGISTAVLANTRTVSLIWLLCAVVIACVMHRWRDFALLFKNRMIVGTIGLAAVGVAAGLAWMAVVSNSPPSTGVAPLGIVNPAPNVRPYQAFLVMLDKSFDYVDQYIGVAGWLDSPAPAVVMAFWGMLFFVALLLPLIARPRRIRFIFLFAVVALLVVPAMLQAFLIESVGFIWQGRYSLPLVVVAGVSSGIALRALPFPTSVRSLRLARVVLLTAGAMHVVAFLYILRRYVVGILDLSTWQTMFTHPSWQPPLGWFTLTLLYCLVVWLGIYVLGDFLYPGQRLLMSPKSFADKPWRAVKKRISALRRPFILKLRAKPPL